MRCLKLLHSEIQIQPANPKRLFDQSEHPHRMGEPHIPATNPHRKACLNIFIGENLEHVVWRPFVAIFFHSSEFFVPSAFSLYSAAISFIVIFAPGCRRAG